VIFCRQRIQAEKPLCKKADLNRDETAMNSAEPELVTACTTLSCKMYATVRSVIWPQRLHPSGSSACTARLFDSIFSHVL